MKIYVPEGRRTSHSNQRSVRVLPIIGQGRIRGSLNSRTIWPGNGSSAAAWRAVLGAGSGRETRPRPAETGRVGLDGLPGCPDRFRGETSRRNSGRAHRRAPAANGHSRGRAGCPPRDWSRSDRGRDIRCPSRPPPATRKKPPISCWRGRTLAPPRNPSSWRLERPGEDNRR